MPSIMRAPPEAETMMSGWRVARERSTARAMVSPTTAPMLPPMKPYSMAERTTGCGPRWPMALTMASLRPVFLRASARRLLVGLEVGEVERVGGAEFEVDELVAGFEEEVDAAAGVDAEVVAALGADAEVGFEIGS